MGKVVRVCFDPVTGAQSGEIFEGDRILRKETDEFLKETVEILPEEPYIKAYKRSLFDLAKFLSGTEVQFLHYLLQFLSFESGALKLDTGVFLVRSRMSDETGLSLKTIDRLLKRLKEQQIIGRNSVGREVQYFMNPWLFMRGKRINKTLYEMFKNSRWAKMYKS